MNSINYKPIVVVLIFFLSCESKSVNNISLNPDDLPTFNLTSSKFSDPKIINPLKLFINDSKLIVTESHRISPELPLIHIFNTQPLKYLKSKGVIGFGPFEIPSADAFQPLNSKNEFLIYSGMDKKFVKYDINDSSMLGQDEFKMPPSNTPLGLFYFLPDSIFVGMSTFDRNKFVEVDLDGQKITGFGTWDLIEGKEDLSYFHHFLLNSGWFKTDKTYEIFVNASIFRDRLEIFNKKSKEIVTIDGPSDELPPFEYYRENMPLNIPITNPFRYRDVYISEDKIYALYGGLSEEHYNKTGELALKIFIFTKDGVPLYHLKLDRSIGSLAVDEKGGKIFGLTTDEDPGIAIFDLPDELK